MRCAVKFGVGCRDEVEIGLVNGVICSRLTGVGAAGVGRGLEVVGGVGKKDGTIESPHTSQYLDTGISAGAAR